MKKIFAVSFLFLFLMIGQVQAAGLVPCGGEGEKTCEFCDFFAMVNGVITWFFEWVVTSVAALMLVIGGVMFLFAGGKSELFSKAKGILTSVAIGLVVILAAWAIVNTVLTRSGIVDPEKGRALFQWWKITCQ